MEVTWKKSSRSEGLNNCIELAHAGTMEVTWKKSSRSEGISNCIELAHAGRMRDSKNPAGPTLTVNLTGLLAAVKAGRLDR